MFYKAKRKIEDCLSSAIQTAIRKVHKNDTLTVKDVRGDTVKQVLCKNNVAYQFMSSVRTSPGYTESALKKAMAMLRQIGMPTFFLTIGPNESCAPELLLQLMKNKIRNNQSTPRTINSTIDALHLSSNEKP